MEEFPEPRASGGPTSWRRRRWLLAPAAVAIVAVAVVAVSLPGPRPTPAPEVSAETTVPPATLAPTTEPVPTTPVTPPATVAPTEPAPPPVVVPEFPCGEADPSCATQSVLSRTGVPYTQPVACGPALVACQMMYDVFWPPEGSGLPVVVMVPGGPLPLQFIASDLTWRVQLASAVDADVYLAIHGNGASVKTISGPETWYCGKREDGAANARLATLVQQAMMDALREYGYEPPDRGIKEDAAAHHSGDFCQFVVTRDTEVPAALLEFLFLSNDADASVLVDPRSHELLARYVAAALDTFMQERRGG